MQLNKSGNAKREERSLWICLARPLCLRTAKASQSEPDAPATMRAAVEELAGPNLPRVRHEQTGAGVAESKLVARIGRNK
jgi:hypothetical protein